MAANQRDIISSLAAIQEEFRKLPTGNVLGCRLLHWNPELEKFRAEVVFHERPASFIVYQPLDVRIDSKPHVFFTKVYKTEYAKSPQSRSDTSILERQYGITYSDFYSKRELRPVLDAFKRCAKEAGVLVASVKDRLASALPAETLLVKDSFHRWIFTVYDVAWSAPAGSPKAATRYIPMMGFGPFMTTDESILYDLDHIRSTPWSEVERRLDKNGWGYYSHFKESYASWGEKLPEYFASRINDIVQASDATIDWLQNQLASR